MSTVRRCDYEMIIGKRKGEICERRILVPGRTKCSYHTAEYIKKNVENNRAYKQRMKNDAENETPREEQPTIDRLTDLRELMEITKRNNDLLLLLTMAIAGMNKK